ncbi:MAG: S8/S53 family peptidase [Bdellovibrionales bacterium]|nr:S8/S53 family peptidase [Bdellovibrionales bacterium]
MSATWGCTPRSRTQPKSTAPLVTGRLNECQVVDLGSEPPLLGGKLTPLWAQEYIGADLAKERLATIKDRQVVGLGVIDSGYIPKNLKPKVAKDAVLRITKEGDFNPWGPSNWLFNADHSNLVTNLILHPRYGSSLDGEIVAVAGRGGDQDFRKTVDLFSGSRAKVINLSILVDSHEEPYRNLSRLVDQGRLLVLASGNDYPRDINMAMNSLPAVFVGSMSPDGLVSSFSVQGKKIMVLAPSDFYVYSTVDDEKPEVFSGTSGASPLVAGSLMNVASLLPEITYDQVDELFRQTSISLPSNRDLISRNGYGMVNAYRMLRLTEQVRRAAPPKSFEEFRRSLRNVDFKIEAAQEYDRARSLLNQADCSLVREGFKSLRRSFLLNEFGPARAALAEAYLTMGFEVNARFYRMIDSELSERALAEMILDEKVETASMIFSESLDEALGVEDELKGIRGYIFASRFLPGAPVVRLARERVKALQGFARAERAFYLYDRGEDLFREAQGELNPSERRKVLGYELARLRALEYDARFFRHLLRFLRDPDVANRKLAFDVIAFELTLLEREKYFVLESFQEWKIETLAHELILRLGIELGAETDGQLAEEIHKLLEDDLDVTCSYFRDIFAFGVLSQGPTNPLAEVVRGAWLKGVSCDQVKGILVDLGRNRSLDSDFDNQFRFIAEYRDELCQRSNK